MSTVPTTAEINADPAGSQARINALFAQDDADAAVTTQAIALGILAQVATAAAPLAGAALGGPVGGAVDAAIAMEAANYTASHQSALAALPIATQANVTAVVNATASVIAAKGSTASLLAAATTVAPIVEGIAP